MIDDLGKEGLSFYPYAHSKQVPQSSLSTPHLDRFATRNDTRIFDNFHTTPICWSTRIEALTGQKTWEIGARTNPYTRQLEMDKSPTDLLCGYLHGYDTAAFGKWHLTPFVNETPTHALKCGFDEFALTFENFDDLKRNRYYGSLWTTHRMKGKSKRLDPARFVDDEAVDACCEFLTSPRRRKRPWYAQMWFNLTHSPVVTVPGYKGDDDKLDKFSAMVEYVDHLIGRVFEALERNGRSENTLVIVTSDNGGNGFAGGKKSDVAEKGINVPFLIRWPGIVEAGREARLAQCTDVFPTLTGLTGNYQPRKYSRSIAPLFRDGANVVHDYIAMNFWIGNWVVLNESWSLRTPPHCRTESHLRACKTGLRLANLRRNDWPSEDFVRITRNLKARAPLSYETYIELHEIAMREGLTDLAPTFRETGIRLRGGYK